MQLLSKIEQKRQNKTSSNEGQKLFCLDFSNKFLSKLNELICSENKYVLKLADFTIFLLEKIFEE